jgi:hypothetical protein
VSAAQQLANDSRLHHQVVRAAGVAGGLHAELPRVVAAQQVAAKHAPIDQLALRRGHAFVVKGCAVQCLVQVGLLVDGDAARKYRLAERVNEKRGLPVQRAAADGTEQMPDQPAGDPRREEHGHGTG